jgi:hypothetical protein
MKRHAVDSSMAESVGYDPVTSTLEIEFKNTGQVWQYYDVPQKVYVEMISGSIGQYYQWNIKGLYSEARIK